MATHDYEVISEFVHPDDGSRPQPGETVSLSAEDGERLTVANCVRKPTSNAKEDAVAETAQGPRGERATVQKQRKADVSDYHTGGGYYELPDGRKVRGKDAAQKALSDAE